MPFGQEIAFFFNHLKSCRSETGGQQRWQPPELVLTSEEVLHRFAVGHFQEAAARIRCQGGIGAIGQ